MKKIIFLLGIFLTFAIVACSPEEEVFYEGDPYVHFLKDKGDAFVFADQTYRDVDVEFGTVQTVSGNPDVKIVYDPVNSTAVEGVDFQILNGGSGTVPDGQAIGKFTIRILKAAATQAGKVANFKIKSSVFGNNLDFQKYSLTMSLTCSDAVFIGTGKFKNNIAWWTGDTTAVLDVVKSTPDGGNEQLRVKNFWDNGDDLVVYYNPTTFAVTIPDQFTGYTYNSGGINAPVWARPSTSAVSSYNPCTRRLTLKIYYYLKGTSYFLADETEEFTGQ
ncbi:hypothetical protein [Chryseobacterium sp. NKUCC03_KSP]|uniref:hypothetical protein n=1 Tax=Chryseobacterium sp. NKUCC03_KSP TaxID=2842125 RepID=UPI001C5ADF7E|nr:hypothetical protein [Chryseobacterium sp. NKUCC03_KSP]MBW3520815.1 hypothetical protein [Chryseobacterium sp. NKUCC03_KSP]